MDTNQQVHLLNIRLEYSNGDVINVPPTQLQLRQIPAENAPEPTMALLARSEGFIVGTFPGTFTPNQAEEPTA